MLTAHAGDPPESEQKSQVDELLRSLPEGHALLLGAPRIQGDFNDTARKFGLHRTGPTGRDYSLKMVWAPERARAIFLGANHGSPHRLNDVWEFDLPTLSWHLLYAPDNARSYAGLGDDPKDVEYRDGILITKRGGPAIIGHTWWGITYDPLRERVLFMNPWEVDENRIVAKLNGDPESRYKGPSLWTFLPAKGVWAFEKTQRPWPRAPYASALEYVPSLKGALWQSNHWQQQSTWLYKPATAEWTDLHPNQRLGDFKTQAPAPEQVAYVDPVRNIMVAHSKRSTHHFDIAQSQWKKVLDAPDDSDAVPTGHDARTVLYYDPISGHGILSELASGKLWAYDPVAIAWHKLAPRGAALPSGSRRLAYFDIARNVFVVLQRDAVWAYRYRASKD